MAEFPDNKEDLFLTLLLANYGANAFVVATNSGLYYQRPEYESKFIQNSDLKGIAITAFASMNNNFIAATANGLYVSHDYARTFSLTPGYLGLSSTSITDVNVDGYNGTFGVISGTNYYLSSDGAFSFSDMGNVNSFTLNSLSMLNRKIFISTSGSNPNNIVYSENQGISFSSIGPAGSLTANRVRYYDNLSSNVAIASISNGLYFSTDKGNSWGGPLNNTTSTGVKIQQNDVRITVLDDSSQWLVGSGTSSTGGLSISTVNNPVNYTSNPITGKDINDIFTLKTFIFVCTPSGFYYSENSGTSFTGPIASTTDFPASQCNKISVASLNTRLPSG